MIIRIPKAKNARTYMIMLADDVTDKLDEIDLEQEEMAKALTYVLVKALPWGVREKMYEYMKELDEETDFLYDDEKAEEYLSQYKLSAEKYEVK